MAIKIAKENPNVTIDLCGPKYSGIDLHNLRHIGEIYDQKEAFAWLKTVYKNYDFIYAADHLSQPTVEFHTWRKNITVPILSPDYASYNLEYSKLYVKEIARLVDIPTPSYKKITVDDISGYEELMSRAERCVFKIDSTYMAFGWQTRVIEKNDDFKRILKAYDGWTDSIFVEEYIEGKDISFHILCNGEEFVFMGAAKDYKKMYDNDLGINCGSAGSYCPVEYFTLDLKNRMLEYSKRIYSYLKKNNILYRGIMYLGFRVSEDNVIYLLEINTRPGNPEFNVILPSINSKNILINLFNASQGMPLQDFEFNETSAVAITVINKNYTPNYKEVDLPDIIDDGECLFYYYDSNAFFNNYYASILRTGKSVKELSAKTVKNLMQSDLKDFRFRSDIGFN